MSTSAPEAVPGAPSAPFNLPAGDQNLVGVSRWTSTPGYVIADAVRVTRV